MDSDYACRLRLIRFALIALLRVCSINLPSNNRNGGDELSVGITVTSNVSYNQFKDKADVRHIFSDCQQIPREDGHIASLSTVCGAQTHWFPISKKKYSFI